MNLVRAPAKFLIFSVQQQQQPADILCLETFQCHLKRMEASFKVSKLDCVLNSDLTKKKQAKSNQAQKLTAPRAKNACPATTT